MDNWRFQVKPKIDIPSGQIAEFCQKHHIRKLSFFGSVLRDDFRPDSDIDVLVEFESGYEPNLRSLLNMERELRVIFRREVDLGERQSVEEDPNYLRRNYILNSAVAIYEG
jgi:predicted nucleotidyltransferase